MKKRIEAGEAGKIRVIHGSYLQDWLAKETDWNWRLLPEYAGNTYCVGDIGSHWMDLAQFVSGSKITDVCANLATTVPYRKRPKAVNPGELEDVKIEVEDYASVLLKFDNGAAGMYHCGGVHPGHKVPIQVEVDGSEASFFWNQETCDTYVKGTRDFGNETCFRDPKDMPPEFLEDLMVGHTVGYYDAFKYAVWCFYKFIADGKNMWEDPADFAMLPDAMYNMRLVDAIYKSHVEGCWVNVEEIV